MAFDEITPEKAHELMSGDPRHVYLDVRTVEEFDQGHAEGALNVPILFMSPAGMEPNSDFIQIVEASLAKDTPMVVGCKMGGRSRRACDMLQQAGFTRLHNIDGGYGGNPDSDHESSQKGWSGSSLPVSKSASPGATFEELRAKVS